ncbi:ubiquitin binding protein [Russula earlei]|uniref:Ubiquitin binding protein n=1 Tax=Russula earlei TaxID=71964 RepID=A0ACC0UG62_9AGAM|nr:ubiquitin binding protein [Russula earlei]
MSTLSSWLWGTSQLDEAIDKATSELLPAGSEDIALNLEICDQIQSKSTQPKDAMRALKRRLDHKNPNVQLLALNLTDVCIKNGGDHFLAEIASREFMDNLVSILKTPSLNRDVKNKILRCVQTWAISFKGKHNLSYVEQVYRTLKAEGFTFPPEDLAIASAALVDTQTAPDWIDSDVCLRCRDPFSFTNRKHHCRNCGRVFDQKCSSKTHPLPHFGITQEVRVCDSCHKDLMRPKDKIRPRRSSQGPPQFEHRPARDLADADLQRAIRLSLEEDGQHGRPGYVPYQPDSWQRSEPPLVDHVSRPSDQVEDDDLDLKAAIEASLREANAPKPSAPAGLETPRAEGPSFSSSYSPSYFSAVAPVQPSVPTLPNYDLAPLESDTIMTFSQMIEQVQVRDGGDLSRSPAVTQLFDDANNLRPKLARSLDDTGRKEELLTEMNDKLAQAVKLYDHILTQQVSRPIWRQKTTSPPSQPLNQWSDAQTPTSTQLAHASMNEPWHQSSSIHGPSQPYQSSVTAGPSYASPSHSPPQPLTQPSYISSVPSPPTSSQASLQYNSAPTPHPSVFQQYQYAHLVQPVSVQQPLPPIRSPAHVINPPQQPPPVAAPFTPVLSHISSPPLAHHRQHSSRCSPLSRHNTIAHAARGPSQPLHQQLPLPPAPVPVPVLPNFPSVPTAPPSIPYGTFDSAPTVVEQPKKEALLIEL